MLSENLYNLLLISIINFIMFINEHLAAFYTRNSSETKYCNISELWICVFPSHYSIPNLFANSGNIELWSSPRRFCFISTTCMVVIFIWQHQVKSSSTGERVNVSESRSLRTTIKIQLECAEKRMSLAHSNTISSHNEAKKRQSLLKRERLT